MLIGKLKKKEKQSEIMNSTNPFDGRTLMSVQHNLAGMFPPQDAQIWNDTLLWQAIPVHTIPEELDYVLAMKTPCPRYQQAFEEYEQSDEVKSMMKSNRSLIQYLEQYVGMEIDRIEQVKIIYQALWIEQLKEYE